jgi:hypothetical protein
MRNVWFQQDGAMAHMARQRMTFLRGMFPGCLISQSGNIPWPARSSGMTAQDFFLWGYLKSKVYTTRPHSIQQLKDRITEGIGTINGTLLQRVMQNFRQRLQQHIKCHGGHLEQVIFKQ